MSLLQKPLCTIGLPTSSSPRQSDSALTPDIFVEDVIYDSNPRKYCSKDQAVQKISSDLPHLSLAQKQSFLYIATL